MDELISIIVPIYNVEKYLNKCVDSILNQTYMNIEVILVDDGSTDSCPQICEEYKKKDKRVKVIHKKNGGLSDARNFGIKEATGKYVGFIDSDDYIETNMYSKLYAALKDNEADVSICGRYVDYEDGRTKYRKHEQSVVMNNKEALIKLNSYNMFDMSACDKLYRKNLFDDIEFPFGKKCEDYYTTYKVFDKCRKVVFIPDLLYHYYQRENSISRNTNIDEASIDAAKSQVEYFKEKHPELCYIASTAYSFSNIAVYNRYLKNGIKCSSDKRKIYRNAVKANLGDILKNSYISKLKKVQAITFVYNNILYKLIYLVKR